MSILISANFSVGYLYARKKFGWTAPDWAYYITIVSSTSVIGRSTKKIAIRLFWMTKILKNKIKYQAL